MMNMKKGIHMSKDALRVVAAAGVLSVVLGLGGVFDAGFRECRCIRWGLLLVFVVFRIVVV